MTIPQDSLPLAPEPPCPRVEAAAREICEFLSSGFFGRPHGRERAVGLHAACSGFRRFGHENSTALNDYRWAVKLMVETGLLACVEIKSMSSIKDEFFKQLEGAPAEPPELLLVSTQELWSRWRAEAPILGTKVAGFRIRFHKPNRAVWLDGIQIASELDEAVFDYLTVLVSSYPNLISFTDIQEKMPLLAGVNQSRFNGKVDRLLGPLWRHLQIEKGSGRGHLLKAAPN